MTCSVCIQYASSDLNKKAVFVTGSSNFKLSFADCLPTDLRCCSEVSWEITDSSLKLEDTITKTAFLSKSHPFTDFIWMCELDEIKGVDIGETYRNEKQVVNSAHYITFYLK
jgi:hypothetical protein